MTQFVAEGLIEQIQDLISAEATLNYTTGETLTIGQSPDPISDFPTLLQSDRILLTIYESGGTLTRRSRFVHQERTFRFVHRGDHPQDAINRAWRLIEWFENKRKHTSLTGFALLFTRVSSLPQVVFRGADGSALADSNLTFLALRKA